MPADFAASLRPWAIDDIQVGDRLFRIPALTADHWLEILLADQLPLSAVLPGLLEPAEDRDAFEDLLLDGTLDAAEWEDLVMRVIGLAAGRDWWSVFYLLNGARTETNINFVRGKLALHRIDATTISFGQWIDAVYGVFADTMSGDDRAKLDLMLLRPPPGVRPEIDRKQQLKAFEELMGEHG